MFRKLAVLLAVLALVACAVSVQEIVKETVDITQPLPPTGTPYPTYTSVPRPTSTSMSTAILVGESGRVAHVVDGDTIDVEIGDRTYRVRYIGMSTPEVGEPGGSEATEINRQLVEGQTVRMEKDVSEADRYGRLLRYVYLLDGTFVNAELVGRGYAQVTTYPPDVRHQALFLQLQTEAREAGRGLWVQPAATATMLAVCSCSGNVYNCDDFATQGQAQACFDYCRSQGRGDVHGLDRDNDGAACEGNR